MAWRREGDKPLSEPRVVKFTDMYTIATVTFSYFNLNAKLANYC